MITLLLATAAAVASSPTPSFTESCSALRGYADGNLVVADATVVPEGPAPKMPQGPNGSPDTVGPTMPQHCRIAAEIDRRTGVDGVPYTIRLELRLPVGWNGRLLFQGGGGLNGMVVPAVGNNVTSGSTAPLALARDYAVVSTDSGHQGRNFDDTSFARDQEAKLNYGYAATGKVADGAKRLIAKVTGRMPNRSYFVGCSNGGREAMMAAQRFPAAFDGVLAGNPGFHLSAAAVLTNYSGWVYTDAARRLGVDSAHLFTSADGALVKAALLRDCDALDGAKDGMIFARNACRFDVRTLACRKGRTARCLDPVKVDAIVRAYRGPSDRERMPIAGSWSFDTGNFTTDWMLWQTGIPTPGGPMTVLRDLVRASLTQYFAFPQYTAPLSGGDAEATRLTAAAASTAAFTDATSTHMSTFAARGGKLMIVSGWSDPVFSTSDLTAYYDRLAADTKVATGKDVAEYTRLFLVPGMAHCGGGESLDDMDALASLVDWVEKDRAPAALLAKGKAFPGTERPICAYPAVARYRGRGPLAAASSFTCA